jgi:hypothetical protein
LKKKAQSRVETVTVDQLQNVDLNTTASTSNTINAPLTSVIPAAVTVTQLKNAGIPASEDAIIMLLQQFNQLL